MYEFLTGYEVFDWIATWAHPFWDVFFRSITDLGYHTFYYLCIAPLFWVVDRRRAVVLFLLLILSAYVNTAAKLLADTPRPDPSRVRVIDTRPSESGSKSFPSGHAQNAVVFWAYAALWARRRWCTVLAVLLVALISFSRLYLGVHFPIDIAGGLAIGTLLLAAIPGLERWAATDFRTPLVPRILCAAAPGALLLLSNDPTFAAISGSLLGVVIAVLWLPQRPLTLAGGPQMAAVVILGLVMQLFLSQLVGRLPPTAARSLLGVSVAGLWIVAMSVYPGVVAVVSDYATRARSDRPRQEAA